MAAGKQEENKLYRMRFARRNRGNGAMPVLTKSAEAVFFGGCLITRPAGDFTVSLYSYPKRSKIPRHCHKDPYFSFVLQGSYGERSGWRSAEDLMTDVAVLHHANEVHEDEFHEPALILAVQFDAEWRERDWRAAFA
jgi:hypothetical protein